jgi:hypothetical protein
VASGRGRSPDVHGRQAQSREVKLNLDHVVIPAKCVAVSTNPIVYNKSDSRKPRTYILSAHQALSYTHIRSIPYHPSISTTLKPKGFSCNLYHQYCKYLPLHTNRIP